MVDRNIIRAIIFLIAGLAVLIVPHKKLYNFQASMLDRLHIKYDDKKRDQAYSMYPKLGATFTLFDRCNQFSEII